MRGSTSAIAGGSLAALACLRTLVVISPLPWFDVDPSSWSEPMAGVGPAGSLAIDVGIMAVSAWLLWSFAGRSALLVAVAAMAVLPAGLLLDESAVRLGWRGWDWIAAWLGAAASVAVARDPRAEARLAWSALTAVTLGACAAWLARGAWQWVVEHPDTLAYFRSGVGKAFLDDRGWDPGGPQAMAYVRRLEQREMSGWFGLANVFSGVLAVAAAAMAGMPRSEGRRGVSWPALAVACAAAVVLNGSKGAIGAMAIGLSAVAALRWRRWSPGTWTFLAVAAVMACAVAPALRAWTPRGWVGDERSLLFRWHYLRTAWPAWLERPWAGTGTEGFQDASARWRPADAVELVQSAHAAFVDWVAQLGTGGLAWATAAMCLLAWSARGAASEPQPLPAPESRDGRPQWIVALACVAMAVVAFGCEAHATDAGAAVVRLVGAAAWAGAAVMLLPRLWSARSCGARMLFPAAMVALCHAQLEMTLWNPGSAAWLLLVLGAAVPPRASSEPLAREASQPQWIRISAAAVPVLACVLAVPVWARHRRMESALEAAAMSLASQLRPGSGMDAASARHAAADALRGWSRMLAADQLMRAAVAEGLSTPRGVASLRAACVDADDAVSRGDGPMRQGRLAALHQASLAWLALADATAAHPDLVGARERALSVTAFDRKASAHWLRAARLAERAGDPDAAVYARRALAADDGFELDPMQHLSPRDRVDAERLAVLMVPRPPAAP